MALRLKTCQYAFPTLASLANNTLTNLSQITLNIPEPTINIRKAWLEISMDDIVTATGATITTKDVNLRLGSNNYSTTSNSFTATHTSEAISLFLERDFTSHFITNWTGSSMTCDVQLQINQSTGTTLGFVNVSCILNITYEYDDSATTQLKTVWIPLNTPVGFLPTTKTSHDTIPALDTYLPEASKTYRRVFIVTQWNNTAVTTDHTVSFQLSSLGTATVTGIYESAFATSRWCRYVWDVTSIITTNTTHTFNVWSSLASRNLNMQAWMVVTYEYNESSSSSIMNSLILPMNIYSPMGGIDPADYSRSSVDFFIEESGVTLNKLAAYVFYQSLGDMATFFARIGSAAFINYTNTGTTAFIAGNVGFMIRNDSPTGITIGRGKNSLFLDLYNTLAGSPRGANMGAFFIINYTSSKHSLGSGAHNHTVLWPVYLQTNIDQTYQFTTTSEAVIIPENNYYISCMGFKLELMAFTTATYQGFVVKAERLQGTEGSFSWDRIYADITAHDSEAGLYTVISQNDIFTRFPGDADSKRLSIETPRRYLFHQSNGLAFYNSFTKIISYHSIPFAVSGNITNSNGGLVTIDLHKYDTGEKLLSTTRSGNGPYSFTWYDNTQPVYTVAYENNSYKGRSGSGIAF